MIKKRDFASQLALAGFLTLLARCGGPDFAAERRGLCPEVEQGASTSASDEPVLSTSTLGALRLDALNPWLTQGDLDDALVNGAGTVDAPGLGSGLDRGPDGSFYMITDRGPNGERDGGVIFPLPRFAPTIARVHLDQGAIVVDALLALRDSRGRPISGISNTSSDDTPFPDATSSTPLELDVNGLDTEDVRVLPNGDFAISDEYGPSLALVDGQTGRVRVRYVPRGARLSGADYPVRAILPRVLAERRKNKGLESLAVAPDGGTAYAVLQAPIGRGSAFEDDRLVRVVRIDRFDQPRRARTGGHFVVAHGPAVNYPGASEDKIYFSSAAWVSREKILLLERGASRMRLVLADFAQATNLAGTRDDDEARIEGRESAGRSTGVTAAATQVVFDSADSAELEAAHISKFEGLAILDASTIAVANDNDFGINDPREQSHVWIIRLSAPLPL